MAKRNAFAFHPVTPDRWTDLETLFGPKGACGGCWCMLNRVPRKTLDAQKGDGNREAMKELVDSGQVPGILAYDKGEPVAWCSVAPRDAFPGLERSRIMKPIDDTPVWSVTCFFIRKSHRRRGLSVALLEAACAYVKEQGGDVVEGYPIEPRKPEMPDTFAWLGLAAAYRKAGFIEVLRRSETRPIMRRSLSKGSRKRG